MSTPSGTPSIFRVPTAVWVYGFLRALAFATPFWVGAGTIGLGAVVVVVLFIPLVAGRRWAWIALLVLDAISLLLTIAAAATSPAGEVPLLVPLLAGAALICLLLPSTRRHVTRLAGEVGGPDVTQPMAPGPRRRRRRG